MIPKNMLCDITKLEAGAIIELFDIDLSEIVGHKAVLRVHNGLNELRRAIIWQGNEYEPYPIKAQGFERSGQGTSNRPTLTASNAYGILNGLIESYEGMIGAVVTRHEVLVKYLDAINFANGNKHADPHCEIVSNYILEQVKQQTSRVVVFELALPCESDGAMLPKRIIIANTCGWIYRSTECGYTGGAVADEFDQPTDDITRDKCSRCVAGCKLRFGQNGILPFGGFPTAAKLS
ncbi:MULTISPECIES: phage minor tail protein L [unclassified Gilliamella]|uniref:phage minor tail protein L n=1 Tax=unclassified Gilliamella TaxID=2685620 RepID=UPI00226A94C5|nr:MULTISPECIES: phage minor tail protein L [unclassified Gilliamella]MCX8664911.1 phage minor tail protein L [Gilliamella sp. B2887]MCX8697507.1 phage minor tail protein L [Gilliamella sp. B3000]